VVTGTGHLEVNVGVSLLTGATCYSRKSRVKSYSLLFLFFHQKSHVPKQKFKAKSHPLSVYISSFLFGIFSLLFY
jgi:hypothetical protein